MAGLAGPHPVFDELLDSSQPKDTEVIIVEEGSSTAADSGTDGDTCQELGRQRRRTDTSHSRIVLPAHWVVLYSLSPYFKAKIERWSRVEHASKRLRLRQKQQPQQQQQQQSPYQYSLQLLVPRGQLELGRRLITAMYSSSPDLSDLTDQQLMQLAALAECYNVGRVVAATAAHLTVDTMPLDTAAAVFELPEACLTLPAFQAVRQTAADKLQQELGDLEAMWADQSKRAAVRRLPFEALLQLLGDGRTRVASEDTALGTAAYWLDDNAAAASKAPQLLDVLRLPYCSVSFLTSSKVWRFLRELGLPEQEVHDLTAMPIFPDTQQRLFWVQSDCAQRPAWSLPRRPASSTTQLELVWKLRLADVRGVFEEEVKHATEHGTILPGPVCNWPGRTWSEQGAPAISTWAQLRGWLEEQHLVHPGDTLHFTFTVTAVA